MKVALLGYGKMGKEIEKILCQRGHCVVLVIDENNGAELTVENLRIKQADIALEFTTPHTAFANIETCLKAGVGVVCGTTGWLDKYDQIVALCERVNGAFFYASNYSLGVNIFFRLNEHLARMMNPFAQYDVRMKEIHHIHKKDAPSGTAITLAEGVSENADRKKGWTMESGETGDRVLIEAERTAEVPGTHIVRWESEEDVITIEHEAKNRHGLAMGAVLAAEYLNGKTGVYSMTDLLGI